MVVVGIAGTLAVSILFKTGSDSTTIACVSAMSISLAVILSSCVVVSDRNSCIERYSQKYAKADTEDRFIRRYHAGNLLKTVFTLGLVILAFILAGFSLAAGIADLSIGEAYGLVFGHLQGAVYELGSKDWLNDILIWESQLPRTIVAIISGASLAVGGAVMQSVVKNPLADPYTTGISSGAVLGATLGIVLGLSFSGIGQYGLVINAFIFSLIPAGIMIFVSRVSNGSPATIVLVGTAVSFIFSAFNTLIMMMGDEEAMKSAFEWSVGSLSGASWSYVPLMLIVTIVGSVFLYATSGRLNLMMMGDNDARALGLNVENYRMLCLLIVSFMTASIVSFLGMIGFLGLISPHIVRLIMGSDARIAIPASAAVGVCLMLFSDVVSRVLATSDMPVGVVLSFIGGPLFLLLVIRSRKEAWSE